MESFDHDPKTPKKVHDEPKTSQNSIFEEGLCSFEHGTLQQKQSYDALPQKVPGKHG